MEFDDFLWLTAEDIRGFSVIVFDSGKPPGEYPDRPIDGPVGYVPNLFTYGDRELDVVLIATSYCHDIARAHSLFDGNKRTALMAMIVFLELHGLEIHTPDDEWLVPIMVGVAEGTLDAYGLYNEIIGRIRAIDN